MFQNLSYFRNKKTQITTIYFGFIIRKIWQILKHFFKHFRQEYTKIFLRCVISFTFSTSLYFMLIGAKRRDVKFEISFTNLYVCFFFCCLSGLIFSLDNKLQFLVRDIKITLFLFFFNF